MSARSSRLELPVPPASRRRFCPASPPTIPSLPVNPLSPLSTFNRRPQPFLPLRHLITIKLHPNPLRPNLRVHLRHPHHMPRASPFGLRLPSNLLRHLQNHLDHRPHTHSKIRREKHSLLRNILRLPGVLRRRRLPQPHL